MRRTSAAFLALARRAARRGLVAAALLVHASGAAEPQPKPQPVRPKLNPAVVQQALGVMEHLRATQNGPVLDAMHYPPDYTKDQIDDDRRTVAVALQFLTNRLGKLESFELMGDPVECYWLGLGMGSSEYWEKISAPQPSSVITFATKYTKAESMMVRLTDSGTEGHGWIRTLEFGIPVASKDAKARAQRLARDMFTRMKATAPKAASTKAAD